MKNLLYIIPIIFISCSHNQNGHITVCPVQNWHKGPITSDEQQFTTVYNIGSIIFSIKESQLSPLKEPIGIRDYDYTSIDALVELITVTTGLGEYEENDNAYILYDQKNSIIVKAPRSIHNNIYNLLNSISNAYGLKEPEIKVAKTVNPFSR